MKYISPNILSGCNGGLPSKVAFTCPLCHTLATQYVDRFCTISDLHKLYMYNGYYLLKSNCTSCNEDLLWLVDTTEDKEQIIYPETSAAIPSASDMPNDVKELYDEAVSISQKSPRAAAALLRVAIEILLPQIGAKKDKLNEMIKELVSNGIISTRIQQAMDFVRIAGNDGAHPTSEILMDDSQEVVDHMFRLLNLIVEQQITEPKREEEFFRRIPEGKIKAIEKRDSE